MAKKTGKELAGIAKNMVLGSLATKGKFVKTVDCTPDWVGLVPLFMDWIQNGNPQQYEEAQRNLIQMAKISDSYRKNQSLIMASPDMYEVLDLINKTAEPDKDGYISINKATLMLVKQTIAKADKK
jgi:hypothetical protein